ncbi:DUF1559 family PulG-like putative transporter [Tautonia plasticadhaerens]|uniref:DUF1559 domain-containing protein n=1 Tax=Tautonia plasticadhaerens TaxID=2527974 RepID=A0A518H6F0_9BACT|nr:DUF1559 domain-containing protein [Tautonia plasticadhaerens]QDV36405.1 hypothetical protein ElP_43290 [Tautonia plasticadhaerens]
MSRYVIGTLLTLFVLLFLISAGFFLPFDFAVALVLGWVFYLGRVLPQVTVDWVGVTTGVLCLALLVVGSHAFLGWLYGQVRAEGDEGEATGGRWKPRWTASMAVIVVLMFVAGISATGVVHQVGWLLTSGRPVVQFGSPSAMWRAQSTNNLKQIALGLANYESAHGTYPPGGTFDAIGRPHHGWMSRMLPFVQRQDLHDRIDFDLPWDHPLHREVFRADVSEYQNPALHEHRKDEEGYALGHYAGNAHMLGGDVPRTNAIVTDGLANKIMAGEVGDGFEPWGSPTNWRDTALGINRSPKGFGSLFPGGANFVLGDGSVRFIKETVDPAVLRSLGTPAGGESVPPDRY